MDWKDFQPLATFLAALGAAVLSSITLWKLQNRKREDEIDLKAFGHSLDKKLKEFESTLSERNAYLVEKGKAAATKEDLEEITRQVEKVRHEFTAPIELLKSNLSKKANLHKLQAEKEFQVYSAIWDKAIDVKFAVANLRPQIEFGGKLNETPEEKQKRWNERQMRLDKARFELISTIERLRPFYPDELYKQLNCVLSQVWEEMIDFEFSFNEETWRMPVDAYKRGAENAGKIIKSLDEVLDLMRKRITEN